MDLHKTWNHRWVTPKAICKKSPIQGLGVFATKTIKKGEVVGVFGGVIVSRAQIVKYRKKMGHVGLQINDDFFICPTTRNELKETGVFNHSCDPNCGFKDSLTLVAIRNIHENEELSIDYAFVETESTNKNKLFFKCNCKKTNCRKKIKSDDWKNLSIQQKYGKWFSTYLKDKIKAT